MHYIHLGKIENLVIHDVGSVTKVLRMVYGCLMS
ncbi:hypothetical protein SASC598P14_014290 [Snodgrassella alvi SCGC AB-598-P14]|nr:hypothetical protein SASC598P14_014290 [Snodgrassella alvi SCGC AB-598-P14]